MMYPLMQRRILVSKYWRTSLLEKNRMREFFVFAIWNGWSLKRLRRNIENWHDNNIDKKNMMKNLQKITFNMFAVNNHTTVESHPREWKGEEERYVTGRIVKYYRYIRECRTVVIVTATEIYLYIYLEKDRQNESELE
jgi:hypothetical protein